MALGYHERMALELGDTVARATGDKDLARATDALRDGMMITSGQPLRMPVVTKEIELGGDYAGWKLTIRRNAPLDVVLRLDGLKTDSGDLGGLIDMLPEIIVRWNFVDEQGDPLPLTAAGARHLPLDLFRAVMEAFGEVIADSAAVPPK